MEVYPLKLASQILQEEQKSKTRKSLKIGFLDKSLEIKSEIHPASYL